MPSERASGTKPAVMRDELTRAVELRESGQPEEARSILLRLVEEHPDDPRANHRCAWVHDVLGLEREAVPFYERAIEGGLGGEDLEGAIVNLGSSYRVLGGRARAVEGLQGGAARFPENRAMQVFLAMALHNVGEHSRAMELLLRNLAETTGDENIRNYGKAIAFYANRLNETH